MQASTGKQRSYSYHHASPPMRAVGLPCAACQYTKLPPLNAPQTHSAGAFGISPSIGYTARCSGFEAACLVLDKSKHSQRAIVWLPKNSRESRWAAIFAVLKCTQSAPQSPSAKSVGIFTFRADPDQVAAFQPACVVRVCKTPANSYRMATPEIVDFGVGLGPS